MYLQLENIRNFSNLYLEFDNKKTLIYGDNGTGKTTILESLALISGNKSFKENDFKKIIKKNNDYGRIDFSLNEIKSNLFITRNEYKFTDKKINIEVFLLNIKSIVLWKNLKNYRNNFLNKLISKHSPKYKILLNYENQLKGKIKKELLTKNSILLKPLISEYIEILMYLREERKTFINKINQRTKKYNLLVLLDENLGINPTSKIKQGKFFSSEDYHIEENNNNILNHFSSGQIKLKLINVFLEMFSIIVGKNKIILIDDAFDELDIENEKKLIRIIEEKNEIILLTNQQKINSNKIKLIKIGEKDDTK